MDDIAFHAKASPQRLAAVDLARDTSWTYEELDLDVGRTAAWLQARGVASGDRVAALARNSVALLTLHHACARLGLIYVPLNWRLASAEIDFLIADADPSLLLFDEEMGRGRAGVLLDDMGREAAALDALPSGTLDRARPSLILYTSGTSGRPKGAVMNEGALAESAINFITLGRVDRNSRFLCDSPLFHVIGLVAHVRPAFATGGAVFVSDGFEAPRTFARLADPALAITHYICVPQMAAAIRAVPGFRFAALAGLTGIFIGGAPNPSEEIAPWIANGIAAANGFGMTECGSLFNMPPDIAAIGARPSSVGFGTPRCETRLVDDGGSVVGDGQAGELQIRGANVTLGYWRHKEATAEAFTPEGWFRSGDIAVRDADGFYCIVDRKKDMFISGGENVYPAEIEAALAGLPGALELAVVGTPDARWGEVGHVAVVVGGGAAMSIDDVLAYLGDRLARYKLPKRCSVVSALPRTGSGKIMKSRLRDILGDEGSAGA